MNWKTVSSSRVSKAKWSDNKTFLEFPNGIQYVYHDVTYDEHLGLINAKSIGKELEIFQRNHKYHCLKGNQGDY